MQAFQRRYIRSITTINDVKRLTAAIVDFLDTYDVPHKEDRNYIDSTPITPAILDRTCIAIRELHQRLTNDFTVAKEVKDQLSGEQE